MSFLGYAQGAGAHPTRVTTSPASAEHPWHRAEPRLVLCFPLGSQGSSLLRAVVYTGTSPAVTKSLILGVSVSFCSPFCSWGSSAGDGAAETSLPWVVSLPWLFGDPKADP